MLKKPLFMITKIKLGQPLAETQTTINQATAHY